MINITVSKISVAYIQPKLWSIVLRLEIDEDAVPLFNQDFSVLYREGDTWAEFKSKAVPEMQHAIDVYKGEKQKDELTQWPSVLSDIQSQLVY